MYRLRILIFLILLSTCANPTAGEQTLTVIYERSAATEFSLPNLEGKTVTLSDYKGGVVVINFWASWCPACVNEMQSMQRGAEWLGKFKGRFVAINIGETPEVVAKFLTEHDFAIPVLLDEDGAISSRWGVKRLPATYVVDPKGRLAYHALGSRQWDDPVLLVPLRSLTMGEW
jgi:peroxiredoxin